MKQRRLWRWLAALSALGCPALALAATGTGMEALDLRTGAPKELLGKALSLAWGLFPVSVVLGLVVEAFSASPDQPRSYAGVAWRSLLVVAFLRWYAPVFGSVIATAQTVAESLSPRGASERFEKEWATLFETLYAKKEAETSNTEAGRFEGLIPDSKFVAGLVGGTLFDALLGLIVAAGHAFQWAFTQLTQILIAFFYVLGPLALVFAIPRAAGAAARWFRAFVTVSCWPIGSALLLALSTHIMFRGQKELYSGSAATAFGALASTLLLVALNVAVPMLASSIVGGAIKNLFSPAFSAISSGALMLAGGAGALVAAGQVAKGGAEAVGSAGDGGGGGGSSGSASGRVATVAPRASGATGSEG